MNQTQGDTAEIIAEEYWGKKGDVDLFIFRKRLAAPSDTPRPVLFLVHGSSFSARTSYDLEVPGHGEYSLMNVFARYGFASGPWITKAMAAPPIPMAIPISPTGSRT